MHVHVHVELTCRAVAHAWYHVNMAAYLALSCITLWYRVLTNNYAISVCLCHISHVGRWTKWQYGFSNSPLRLVGFLTSGDGDGHTNSAVVVVKISVACPSVLLIQGRFHVLSTTMSCRF